MNLDDWRAALDERPVTAHQRGAIMRECGRLGLRDRGERLAVLAALIGLEELNSTADLTQGQGGKVVGILQRIRDRSELPGRDAADEVDKDQADERGGLGDAPAAGVGGMTLAEALCRVAVLILLYSDGQKETGATNIRRSTLNAPARGRPVKTKGRQIGR